MQSKRHRSLLPELIRLEALIERLPTTVKATELARFQSGLHSYPSYLIELAAFDATGQRIGYGGGYYDRSFAFRRTAPAPPRLVGVAYACQELPELAAEDWDVPLDAVATELDWLAFGR